MNLSPLPFATAIVAMLAYGVSSPATEAAVTLNTLTENVMVGPNDTDSGVAPVAPGVYEPNTPGNPVFTSSYAGMLRARATTEFQRRTQWNFRFDASALSGIAPGDISSVTLRIPQIGRLNNQSYTNPVIRLYANTYDWNDDGSVDYPTWNRGRSDSGGDGMTIVGGNSTIGTYNTFGTATDTSDPDVEGTFIITSITGAPADGTDTNTTEGITALLTTVQSWATDPADNEGFLLTYQYADNSGLAFGTPTLEIEVVPETTTGGLLLLGVALLSRRRRA